MKLDIPTWFILGIQYDGSEYCKVITQRASDEIFEYTIPEMKVVLKSERDLFFSVYEVDADCNVLRESSGSFQFITFKGELPNIYK